MTLFAGTLLIVLLSCAAMAAGVLLGGRPLAGGCGRKTPGAERCADCPHREDGPAADTRSGKGGTP